MPLPDSQLDLVAVCGKTDTTMSNSTTNSHSALERFLACEAAGGVVLIISTVLALLAANTALHPYYEAFLHAKGGVHLPYFELHHSVHHWINDGLMVVFFFVVGLEIKREVVSGELRTWQLRALPACGALGGMVVPAAIFLIFNYGDSSTSRGWAIPSATDIAFAIGVLSLVGARAPSALKAFLTALAIIDDLGAIVVIAFFYSTPSSWLALVLAIAVFCALLALNRSGVRKTWPYVLLGVLLWQLVYKSGVHATIAGVLLALTIPGNKSSAGESLCDQLEHALHPWVAFVIMPIFAFANAGLVLANLSLGDITHPLVLGVSLGLFLGKPLGICLASALAVGLGIASVPHGSRPVHLLGVACLAGVGFTMSLFIGMLAFPNPEYLSLTQLGVMLGSLASAFAGLAILVLSPKAR